MNGLTTEGTEVTEDGQKMKYGAEGTEGTEKEEGLNEISHSIIGAAIEVHRELGPGLLESVYEACLQFELCARGHRVERQRPLPVVYKGIAIDCAYRMDLVVDEYVVVEVKTVDQLLPVHEAQLLSYLRLSSLPLGLLINFHGETVKQGIRRLRRFKTPSPSSLPSIR